jgi:alpha-1,2-mannosyltransferase
MPAMRTSARINRSVVVTLLCLGAGFTIFGYLHGYELSWLAIDHAAVRQWLGGEPLYAYRSPTAHVGTALSPIAAFLLAPVAFLPLQVAGWLLALGGLAALLLSLVALAGPVARRYGRSRAPAVLIAAALALALEPVRSTLGLGCLDLLLFGLVTADVVALRRSAWARSRAAWWPGPPASRGAAGVSAGLSSRLSSGPASRFPAGLSARSSSAPPSRFPAALLRRGWATGAWAGVGTGVATALGVSPVLFIGYLVVTRQWRAAVTAVATTATLLTGAALVAPEATTTWLGSVLPELDRSGPLSALANQSLAGVLSRLYDSTSTPVLLWLSFSGLLVAVGLSRARGAHTDGDEIAAFTLVGLATAAVGPVSRIHELVWVLPAVLILVDAAARRRVTTRRPPRQRRLPGAGHAIAAMLTFALFVVDPNWTAAWNGYTFALILLLNALPWRPGVAPAIPARRRPIPVRRAPAIPGPRGS